MLLGIKSPLAKSLHRRYHDHFKLVQPVLQLQMAIAAASGIMASVGPPGQQMQSTAGGSAGSSNKTQFQDNIQRLTKVWAAQEANRLKASGGTEDAKVYMGVKYERKQKGPFQGKLVSQGTIISIDGEDYVEYRILTKP
ncbi:hypothetical protein QBC46DRAFT_400654, partial [Diplogelasinospora grovesii]